MSLKKIELKGFKSFADKTTIEFNNNITCVVGPNGSGKSNITDAFRWVLGEQKYKNLRGSQMQDVIFNGTKTRSPLGYAEVSVVFENKNGLFKLDFSEVSITRRLFRSGESEYFINKTSCRLKDIKELIMDTGIGVEGYSIIAQGRIDQLLSSTKGDRRIIFDEAAGIVKHKNSKDEALKKLERTNSNLERVNDIVSELEVNVKKLEIESKKAKEYKTLSEELFHLELNIAMDDIENIDSSLKIVVDEITQIDKHTQGKKETLEKYQKEYENKSIEVENLEKEIKTYQIELDEVKSKEVSYVHSIDMAMQKKSMLSQNLNQVKLDIEKQKSMSDGMLLDIQKLEKKSGDIDITNLESMLLSKDEIIKYEQDFENLNVVERYTLLLSKQNFNESQILQLKEKSLEINNRLSDEKGKLEKLETYISDISHKLNNSKINRDVLVEQEKANEGYSFATKKVLSMAKNDKSVYGIVKDLFKVDEEYEVAIEIILGRGIQNIVVEDKSVIGKYIDELKKTNSGRATFLPIKDIYAREESSPKLFEGFYGSAISLLKFDKYFQPIMNYMLRNVYIVKDLDCAYKLSKLVKTGSRIVSVHGEVMNVGGSISGGSLSKNSYGLLKRARNIKKFEFEAQKYSNELSKHMAEKKIILRELDELAIAQNDNSSYLNVLLEKRGALIGQIEQISINISSTKSQKFDMYNGILEQISLKEKQNVQLNNDIKGIEENIRQINVDRENISSNLSQIHTKIMKLTQKNSEIKSENSKLYKTINNLRNEYNDSNDRYVNLNVEKTRFETKKESILQNLWDKYELSYAQASDKLLELAEISKDVDCNKIAKKIRGDLKKLGDVNLNSIEEFDVVNERYQFLITQRKDLLESIEQLSKIIFDIDKDMKDSFLKYFDIIKKNFDDVFKSLFGGGSTDITLSDPDDVLDSEVNIIVQPPGKKLQSMELMSGGEKALTAIALLFGILRTKPSPFCILDEIEASLDDLNVFRFSEFLKKDNQNSQFVVITHRRGTMEIAEALYGVTMQEKGVSTIISKKLGGEDV